MVVQDGERAIGDGARGQARDRTILSSVLVVYLLFTLTMMAGMSLPKDPAISLAGLLTWSLAIIVIEARACEARLGIRGYGTLFDCATGFLVQAAMYGVYVFSAAPFDVTFGLSVLSTLPCLAIVGISKRALFTASERQILRDARHNR